VDKVKERSSHVLCEVNSERSSHVFCEVVR
jgi:hypothetical protein